MYGDFEKKSSAGVEQPLEDLLLPSCLVFVHHSRTGPNQVGHVLRPRWKRWWVSLHCCDWLYFFFLCAKNCQHLFSSWFRFQHVPTQKKVEGPDISALLVSFWCGLFQVVGKVYPMRENHWNQPSRWKRGSWINDSSEFWQLHLTMEVNNCWSQHQRKN